MADNASLLSFIARAPYRRPRGRGDGRTVFHPVPARTPPDGRCPTSWGTTAGPCRSRQRVRGGRMPLELYRIWHASTSKARWSP